MNGQKLDAYLDSLDALFEPGVQLPVIQDFTYRVNSHGTPYRTTIWPKRLRKAVLWLRCMANDHGPWVHLLLDSYTPNKRIKQ